MYQIYNLSTGEVVRKRIKTLVYANSIASYLEDYSKYDRGYKFGVRLVTA